MGNPWEFQNSLCVLWMFQLVFKERATRASLLKGFIKDFSRGLEDFMEITGAV